MTNKQRAKADAEYEAEKIAEIKKLNVGDHVKVTYCGSTLYKWSRAIVTRIGRKYAYAESLQGGSGTVSTVGFIRFVKL